MKKFALLLVILLPFFATGCATVSVHTDQDPGIDFSTYRTWAWAPPKGGGWSPGTIAVIQTSLQSGLQAKGYLRGSRPDFLVSYHIVRQDKTHVSTITTGTGPLPASYWYNDYYCYRGYYGFWPGYTQTYTQITPYTEGTLIVDFIDTKSHEAVWRGTASAVVSDHLTNQNNLANGIQKMLASFPSRQ